MELDSWQRDAIRVLNESLVTKPAIYVNSQWYGHCPFMIALMKTVKPSSYVELGTHNGCSFFAACQGAESVRDPKELSFLAIDSWEGDAHAGAHKPSVLKRFEFYIAQNFPWASYRRDFFENVAPEVEERSLDVLHIDGLHTYEAVKGDFELWSPKVKEGGVILFHDTHEKAEGFGVWKFWEELKQTYPTIEFAHSHGLGVLCLGTPSPELQGLFDVIATEEFNYAESLASAADLQNEAKVFDFFTQYLKRKPKRLMKYIERFPVLFRISKKA